MRYVTEIVWHVGLLRGLEQWLMLLSVMLSGPAFAAGASGIGAAELENGSATPLRTPQAGEFWVSSLGDDAGPGSKDRPFKPIHHDRPPHGERYPALSRVLSDEPGQPKGNEISRNICAGGPGNVFSLSRENEFVRGLVKVESNLTEGDPGLVAPEKGDFRLKEDSPALKLGFQPIPLDKIGPYPDEYR